MHATTLTELVRLPVAGVELEGELTIPPQATGIVVFAQGGGSSYSSPRQQFVAHRLQSAGLGTLLFDLLTRCEDARDVTHRLQLDVELLTARLLGVTDWLREQPEAQELGFGYFGASPGAAAALCASAQRPAGIRALVCRGARPDLAADTLARVTAPTLLIVGGWDDVVLQLNREALRRLAGEKRLEIVPRATGLFDEPGALDEVAQLAARWFAQRFHAAAIANPS